MIHLIRVLLTSIVTVCSIAHAATSSPPDFLTALQSVRFSIVVEHGAFSGPGAGVLLPAIAEAKYVFVGEDHLTREIPAFTAAVCDVMATHGGLSAYAMEASREAAAAVAKALAHANPEQAISAQLTAYPDSMAFLNVRQEMELARHCMGAQGMAAQLWGLDQEFLGSAGWLLDRLAAQQLSPRAARVIAKLKGEDEAARRIAAQTGDPSQLLMFKTDDRELSELMDAVTATGNRAALLLARGLIDSHRIYTEGGAISNGDRARLLKQTLRGDMEESPMDPSKQRVLLKFGDDHGYKGLNPLHQRDLGNYVAELADGENARSLHIDVLGARGTHRLYAGYERPTRLEPFDLASDPDYAWVKPAIDSQGDDGWTLFDLRALRFRTLSGVTPEMAREIYGYDFLLIIRDLTPADMLH